MFNSAPTGRSCFHFKNILQLKLLIYKCVILELNTMSDKYGNLKMGGPALAIKESRANEFLCENVPPAFTLFADGIKRLKPLQLLLTIPMLIMLRTELSRWILGKGESMSFTLLITTMTAN